MFLTRNRFKKNQSVRIAVAIAGMCVAAIPTFSVAETVPIEQQIQDVVSHLVGVMDTSAQAAANPNAPNVRMTTCKVKVEGENNALHSQSSVFLYQEQALSRNLTTP